MSGEVTPITIPVVTVQPAGDGVAFSFDDAVLVLNTVQAAFEEAMGE